MSGAISLLWHMAFSSGTKRIRKRKLKRMTEMPDGFFIESWIDCGCLDYVLKSSYLYFQQQSSLSAFKPFLYSTWCPGLDEDKEKYGLYSRK
jgi:hypothetical protein